MIDDDKLLDGYIKQAIEEEVNSYPLPDADRLWQRIETTIELCEQLQKQKKNSGKRAWIKVASVFAAIFLAGTVFGLTQKGEALPFGSVFEGLRTFVSSDHTLVQFRFGQGPESRGKTPPSPPPDDDMEEMLTYQTNLTDTTLEELSAKYSKTIYYPADLPESSLKKVQYLVLVDKWTIIMDFSLDRHDFLFRQEDIVGEGAMGIGYGPDTKIDFHRLDGVEYMTAELRYGIVDVRWTENEKLFDLTCNLTVEEALRVAGSLQPYSP